MSMKVSLILWYFRTETDQFFVLFTTDNCLSKVYWTIDDGFFLFSLQNSGNDGLRRDTVAPVVHHHRAQSVQPFEVNIVISLHSLKIITLKQTER